MQHQSSLHETSMTEKLIMNVLIKVLPVLYFYAELYRYSKRNVAVLADNEVITKRVEPCIDAQSSYLGFMS